ncbi:hypothetical protein GKZ90_0006070 [Flavobacterium sp. MC2016-06]|jgi:hypothetical protein|uniref:hypothetical protein n=1 Tax=Flavobacterium sp. MC2016-06 TaxID=2676308 RepID=UPI0012BA6B1C|nr:hypothetical protein [Flavobacterium sp. MC2016-06]MBU3857704.1 hypothetical protein [Flavobacterium sp. MC2016-06]
MKKRIYITLTILILSLSVYYYWQNRYVEIRPVLSRELDRQIIFFQNDFYRIAERNETPSNFYKNIRFVLDHQSVDYIVKDDVVCIKYKDMNDLEMIWNYTNKTNDLIWIKQKQEEDIFNKKVNIKKN